MDDKDKPPEPEDLLPTLRLGSKGGGATALDFEPPTAFFFVRLDRVNTSLCDSSSVCATRYDRCMTA